MDILVTGGAGFIGSNFIHHILYEHQDWKVINLDKLTYAGNLENLKAFESDPRYQFVKGDITDSTLIDTLLEQSCDVIVNFAAESHVDRSILDSCPFAKTNVLGTQVLLEKVRRQGVKLFIQISTDEVYGSLGTLDKFMETSPLLPGNPYSASKAAADCFCRAYNNTYNLPIIITRCTNNYGPFQFPEKLIPLIITNALEDKEIPLYGDGLNIRDWIFVEDHCRAIDLIIQHGKPGEIYNIGGNNEITNLKLVHYILDMMNKPHSLITFVADRPGHDQRYALNTDKISQEIRWKPSMFFEENLKNTVEWYINNDTWWRKIKTGEYTEYYHQMYYQR